MVCAAIDGDYGLIMRAIHREPWMYHIAVVLDDLICAAVQGDLDC